LQPILTARGCYDLCTLLREEHGRRTAYTAGSPDNQNDLTANGHEHYLTETPPLSC
jgi:hypothetical protein